MKSFNLFNIESRKKLIIINLLIALFLGIILYFSLPSILNYPPNSTDNEFQIEVVGIGYTPQFIIILLVLLLLIYMLLNLVYKKLSIPPDKLTSLESIRKLRKKAFNYPFTMLLFELFVPPLFVILLLMVFNTSFELTLRITAIIFTFSSLFAILSYMLSKRFFSNILISTAKQADNQTAGTRVPLYCKLLIQLFPLFLYSFVLILLIAMSLLTVEKGNLLHQYYKQELSNYFNTEKVYTIQEIENIFETIEYNSDNDHYFIISEDGEVISSTQNLNDFFIKYTLNFYDETEGYTYEYYGQNIEGAVIKVQTDIGDCYIGVRYFVFNDSFILPFLIAILILIIINILLILYIGRDLTNDINNVTQRMNQISSSDNIISQESLPLISNDELSDLTESFNYIQSLTQIYVKKLHDSQETLMERERLASLGQLIGGIAHNLKTPIMSISGAAEGLTDLIKEYEESIADSEVTIEDHRAIAKDMSSWVSKIKSYSEYMSDVITAVKGQAVTLTENESTSFNIDELVKRINILMKHELKNSLTTLNIDIKVKPSTTLHGDITSLVQVINNIISNSIQAYNGEPNNSIDLIIEQKNKNIVFSIKDYASGLPDAVKEKLFKEMITTKGKNGTGLGLFMSYSTIRAHFNGNITYESETGKGTTFHIIIPL